MINENLEYKHPTNSVLNVLVGVLIGGLAGAVTMLLVAPQSGKRTRVQIREKGIELRDRATGVVEDAVAQVRLMATSLPEMDVAKPMNYCIKVKTWLPNKEYVSDAVKAGKKAIQSS